MSYIRVIYKTDKFDYVPGDWLDFLITIEEITHFYRASEKKWINVRFGPIRGRGGHYQGPERRRTFASEEQKGLMDPRRPHTHWFECLWRHHGEKA